MNLDWESISHLFVYDPKAPMIFNSAFFLWIFTAFISLYYLLRKTHYSKQLYVIAFSLFFYYKSSGIFFLLLIFSTFMDYALAWWMYYAKGKAQRYMVLIISLVTNLGILGYFKYTNFLGETWAAMTGGHWERIDIFLPVGVSFFTFQSLSYTIDVYRGELKPLRSLLDYGFFISFFPQLVAGPIVRASDFIPQIFRPTFVSREMFGKAVWLIASGLFKKAVISDYISLNFVDRVFDAPNLYSGFENLMGVYGYALQIYCDFSGYSDMAIGIALLLGFVYPANFNSPYQSKSITEFWRRWHISLSTWLRDYLYISLGGNRKGRVRTYVNLFVTMVIGGLWHGASLRFIIWGALHGAALAIDKAIKPWVNWEKNSFWRILGVVITFHFVCACWVFFRAADMKTVGDVFTRIFAAFNGQILPEFLVGYKYVVILMVLGYFLHFIPVSWEQRFQQFFSRQNLLLQAATVVAVIYFVAQIKSSEVQPFIYFQF